jgi:TPR repeat protein
LIGSCLAIAFWALRHIQLADIHSIVAPAGLATLMLALTSVFVSRGSKPPSWAWLVLVPSFAAYGYGFAVFADTAFDHRPPRVFTPQVLGQFTRRGPHGTTEWYVQLGPWGPYGHPNDQEVLWPVFESTTLGGAPVCASLHEGALGAAWYTVDTCRNANHAQAEHALVARQQTRLVDPASLLQRGRALTMGGGMAPDRSPAIDALSHAGGPETPDYATVASRFRQAAKDDPESAEALGYLNEAGLGIPADEAEARRLYEFAAGKGDLTAQENLATMEYFGSGGPMDVVAAFRRNLNAAKQGRVRAMNAVGLAYMEGLGVPLDTKAGMAWLLAAAGAGQPNAMHTLGSIFVLAGGWPPLNAADAYRWLSLAVRFYPKDDPHRVAAQNLLQRAATAVIDGQRVAIDREVASWQPAPPRIPHSP